MIQTALNLITRLLVPKVRRMAVTGKYFGLHFPLRTELRKTWYQSWGQVIGCVCIPDTQ